MIDELSGTKFTPPRPHQATIVRRRLIDDLSHAVRSAPVTLVSAPAGSGKTTLLATFVQSGSGMPTAWLTVDEDDNDPTRFARGLIRSLESLDVLGEMGLDQALANGVAEPRQLVTLCINHILAASPSEFLVVLDDLHWISERATLALIDYLLDHLPPSMRLILSGRYEPPLALTRLRARRQLAELNLTKLAFTPVEIKAFLTHTLPLDNVDVYLDTIQQQTEGWAAGIALFAGVADELPTGAERQTFLNLLGRSHRLVFDFLAEEILNVQRPEVRAFLLSIAVLSDITVDACRELTGRDDAFTLLDEVYRRNLFLNLYRGDDGQPVYRYHDLFAAFLRERLMLEQPVTARALHRRAAEISRDSETRLAHWLAAQEWDAAAALLTTEGERWMRQGATGKVRQWIGLLPQATRFQYPYLIQLLGVCAAESWELDAAAALLRQAADLLADQPEQHAGALLHLATTLSTSGRIAEARTVIEQALTVPITPGQRAHLLIARAWQSVAVGDSAAVCADLDDVLDLIEQTGDESTLRVIAPQFHVQFTFYAGGIERAERFCRLAEQFARDSLDSLQAASLSQKAWLFLWSGDWDNALVCAEAAGEISDQLGTVAWLETNVRTVRCVCLALGGQTELARAVVEALFAWLNQPEMVRYTGQWLPLFQFVAGRLYWAAGDSAEAERMAQALAAGGHAWPGFEHLSRWMQGLLLLERGNYDAAVPVLEEACAVQSANPALRLVGDARCWLAHAYAEAGKPQAALDCLAPLLEETDSRTLGRLRYEGAHIGVPLLRLAVRHDLHPDVARRALELFGPAQIAEDGWIVPDTGEMLTPREVEVLRLIVQGASNADIADALTISIHTVKIHVAHVLAKLGVPSRTAAAVRAREWGVSSQE